MEILNREAAQAERAGKIKNMMRSFGKNLSFYICLMTPILLVGVVWFDMSPMVAWRTMYGGIPLVAVYVMAERAMNDIGQATGKADNELLESRREFRTIRREAIRAGTAEMGQFIEYEVQTELENTRRIACRKLQLDYTVYLNECTGKSKKELTKKFKSRVLGAKVYAINMIRPIVLTEDMILNDSSLHKGRGGIGETGEEYTDKKRGVKSTLWSILSVFLFTGFAFGPARTFSWSMVLYTIWALFLLVYRMARGYKDGIVAYADVQVKNYADRIHYLERYLEWKGVREKTVGEKTVEEED